MKKLFTIVFSLNIFVCTTALSQENSTGSFMDFMEQFARDSIFQRQHTVFPLEYRIWDPGMESENPKVNYIKETDWKPMTFDPKPGIKETSSGLGNYNQRFVMEEIRAVIKLRGVDNGIYTDFIFERRDSSWYLAIVEDYST